MSKSRIVSLVAGLAGIISAFVAAAQAANLFSLVPAKYAWITVALPIVSLFIVGFSERIQGGASVPEVRADAESADRQKAARSRAGNGNTLRCVTGLLLVGALALSSLGAMCNTKPGEPPVTKEQAVATARDIASGIRSALPVVTRLNATAGKVLETALPIADSVITAIEQSNPASLTSLFNELIPIIDSTVAQFSNNVTVLGFLALADIGIHFLINHASEIFGSNARELAKARRAGGNAALGVVADYALRPVWGCKYHPEKCQP